MSQDDYILYLSDKVAAGEIGFDRVRMEAKRHGLNERQARLMVRLVDNEVQLRAVTKVKEARGNSYIIVGGIMVLAGLVSILVFAGSVIVYLVGYAPFTTGMALIIMGRRSFLKTPRTRKPSVGQALRSKLGK